MNIDKTQCREYWESLQDDSTVAFTGKHDVLCLLGEVAKLEEIETDLNNTIGFIEQGIADWKSKAEGLKLELQDSLNLNKLLDERLTELEGQLTEYQQKVTADVVANLLCYLVDRYENQPLSEIKLQEIGTQFLKDKYYNKPIPPLQKKEAPNET